MRLTKFLTICITVTLAVSISDVESRVFAAQHGLGIGKHVLGESLKEFRSRYPKADCRRGFTTGANGKVEARDEIIACCINDKESLTEFTQFPILQSDGCKIQVGFYSGKLSDIHYLLDVRTVPPVCKDFMEFYGPPNRVFPGPKASDETWYADWWDGDYRLEVSLNRFSCLDLNNPVCERGERWLTAVIVSLWKIL